MTVRRLPDARQNGSRAAVGEHDRAMTQRPVSRVRAKSAAIAIHERYQIVKESADAQAGTLPGTCGRKNRQMHRN
jgi:hypothetical protein